MSEQPDHLGRAVELFVYAPVGFGQIVIEERAAVLERARRTRPRDRAPAVTSARSTGQVAIAFGMPDAAQEARRQGCEHVAGRDDAGARADRAGRTAAARAAALTAPVDHAVAEPFAIRAADAPASERAPDSGLRRAVGVAGRRAAGRARRRRARRGAGVRGAHRQRRTILGKIEQLAG